jgi:hypothetical protein
LFAIELSTGAISKQQWLCQWRCNNHFIFFHQLYVHLRAHHNSCLDAGVVLSTALTATSKVAAMFWGNLIHRLWKKCWSSTLSICPCGLLPWNSLVATVTLVGKCDCAAGKLGAHQVASLLSDALIPFTPN